MRAFVDTSSLIKKYVIENGSDEFDGLLEKISQVIVSPLYYLEVNSAVERRLRERSITAEQALRIRGEVKKDLNFFYTVAWNEDLEEQALNFIQRHHLKILDSIQLASGVLAQADAFIVSDRKLYLTAKKELKNVSFI